MTKNFRDTETKTAALFAPIMDDLGSDWRQRNMRSVWIAQSGNALPLEDIHATLCVLCVNAKDALRRMEDEREIAETKKTLSKLVRKGILRSRVSRGQRLWEVNY